jgi:glutamate dehydrogenase (NAD(P)+)
VFSESDHICECRIIAEGADGPTTPEAVVVLDAKRGRGVFVIPAILGNTGGVIVSHFEWVQDLQQPFRGRSRSSPQPDPRQKFQ